MVSVKICKTKFCLPRNLLLRIFNLSFNKLTIFNIFCDTFKEQNHAYTHDNLVGNKYLIFNRTIFLAKYACRKSEDHCRTKRDNRCVACLKADSFGQRVKCSVSRIGAFLVSHRLTITPHLTA